MCEQDRNNRPCLTYLLFVKERDNAFVAMCQFENNVETMTFSNCNLFKRSFTNKGLGFTFNNELEEKLIKKDYRSKVLFHNNHRIPALMKSASSEHSLRVVIENNAEEVLRYEKDKTNFKLKPRTITITLHNPKEVADVRSGSFKESSYSVYSSSAYSESL